MKIFSLKSIDILRILSASRYKLYILIFIDIIILVVVVIEMMIIMMMIEIMTITVITVVVVIVDIIYYYCCCNRIVKYATVFVRMDQNLDQTCEEHPLTPSQYYVLLFFLSFLNFPYTKHSIVKVFSFL